MYDVWAYPVGGQRKNQLLSKSKCTKSWYICSLLFESFYSKGRTLKFIKYSLAIIYLLSTNTITAFITTFGTEALSLQLVARYKEPVYVHQNLVITRKIRLEKIIVRKFEKHLAI